MNCDVIVQPFKFQSAAGQPSIIAKCTAGQMNVLEIVIQGDADAHYQVFEGNGVGKPMSMIAFVQQFLMWSKPGKVVKDDVYVVVQEGSVNVTGEVRSVAMGDREGV